MNRKALIIVFLFVHVLVHPLVHVSALTDSPVKPTVAADLEPVRGSDDCGLCRVSNTLVLLAVLALISAAIVTTRSRDWTRPSVRSTELLLQLPSRAPPALA